MVNMTKGDSNLPAIGLFGYGRLLDGVRRALSGTPLSVLSVLEDLDQLHAHQCALVVYCADSWQPGIQKAVNTRIIARGIPLLRAYVEFGVGIVGPFVLPGEPGCVHCVEMRRKAHAPNAEEFVRLGKCVEAKSTTTAGESLLVTSAVDALVQIVASEISRWRHSPSDVTVHNALIHLDLATWQLTRHRMLPEPECPDCGQQVLDTAEAATIELQSRPKATPQSYRIRELARHEKELRQLYVDQDVGLIDVLAPDTRNSWVEVVAQIGLNLGGMWQRQAPGFGRTLKYRESRVVAIAEALERYGGNWHKGKRVAVRASFRQLGDEALDPMALGLHAPEQYALPEYELVPYHPDLEFNWVWGYSFQRQRPILVPERYAYYGLPFSVGAVESPPFVYEISNGCALGSCLEEAIFYAALEVIERDAFLMTWYARLSLPRIDLASVHDPTVRLLIEHIEYTSGYTVYAYDATLDHSVPCAWIMLVDEQGRDHRPKVICGAAAHPRASQTLVRALLELGTSFSMLTREFEGQRARARALEMLADPFAVREMADHSLLYCLPEAFDRLDFLVKAPEVRTFDDAFGNSERQPVSGDLRDDVNTLISHSVAQGIDVVVVDQTTPEHRAGGLCCVKVIMPGMLPMTFGQQFRRCVGFPRLRNLPRTLGFREHPVEDNEVNPFPHPFP